MIVKFKLPPKNEIHYTWKGKRMIIVCMPWQVKMMCAILSLNSNVSDISVEIHFPED